MKLTNAKRKINRRTSIVEKGITLVALVVTIIILLILAGVTLNLVLSNNGLIGKAKQGVATYEKSSVGEEMSNLLMQYMLDKEVEETKKDFDEYAKENGASDAKKNGDNYEVEYKGYIFTIDAETLEVTKTEKAEPSAKLVYVGVVDASTGAVVTEKKNEGTTLKIQVKAEADKEVTLESVIGPDGSVLTGNEGIYTSNNTITQNGTYTFKVVYKLEGETKTKDISITVKSYKNAYIGKYVKYEPDKATYSKDLLGVNYTGDSRNSSDFTTEEYTSGWRILDYDDETGEMIIVMAQPTKNLYLSNARGYNNGVDILNDMCAKLFSKKTDGWNVEARSMTIEDIEDRFNDAGIAARDAYKSTGDKETVYNHTKDYDDSNKGRYGTNRRYPTLYAEEIGSGTAGTGAVKTNGLGWSKRNPNVSYDASNVQFAEAPTKLTVTQTYYHLSWNKSYFKDEDYLKLVNSISGSYWLASRCVGCYSYSATFGLRSANSYSVNASGMDSSVGDVYYRNNGLRAVVSLGSGVQITGSESGADVNNAMTISK